MDWGAFAAVATLAVAVVGSLVGLGKWASSFFRDQTNRIVVEMERLRIAFERVDQRVDAHAERLARLEERRDATDPGLRPAREGG